MLIDNYEDLVAIFIRFCVKLKRFKVVNSFDFWLIHFGKSRLIHSNRLLDTLRELYWLDILKISLDKNNQDSYN